MSAKEKKEASERMASLGELLCLDQVVSGEWERGRWGQKGGKKELRLKGSVVYKLYEMRNHWWFLVK